MYTIKRSLHWSEEELWKLHHYRRMGLYPEQIAPLLPGRTLSSVITRLSRDKTERHIEHKKLKPKYTKFDKLAVAKWREIKKQNPYMSYEEISRHVDGNPHPTTICKKLAKELYGELDY